MKEECVDCKNWNEEEGECERHEDVKWIVDTEKGCPMREDVVRSSR